MYELSHDYFYKVTPLLKNGHPHPEVLSIIEHNNPGWIFSDHIDSPRTALIWSKGMQGFYLIGDHNNDDFMNELDDYLTKSIFPKLRELGMSYFEVSGHHNKWNMESLFASWEIQQWDQLVFKCRNLEAAASQGSSRNHPIRTINLRSQEWKDQVFTNRDFVDKHIKLFWDSYEDFYHKGYGYVAIDGSEIIGVCYSSFVAKETHAIGIETLPQHQKRGIGTYLASFVVKDIIENGFTAYWDCSLTNEASTKLALRLGFQQVHQYKCVGFVI
ncbi:hypothetical protein BVG16_21055 [Paenibacillus selenitireducens]|uniref:N-acetyltransferase domain-containing protein n=1 Tax=Paenibacillus selenitireducens TaxID=1324314 RepID=A0A1T2X5I7_9BACL|nr:GNAT family N-acetyltransferase [Paenibacillus selenitireducens]OPA75102.1 hypothetical protein BVG16_21055 [Paenibacillus selenitireducens]